jgi:hypothetical protein
MRAQTFYVDQFQQGPISQRTENIFLWAEIIFLWRVALSELVLRENSTV